MRYVYVIENRELINDRYELGRTEIFTSLKKARASVDNSILCNKGYNIEKVDFFIADGQDVTDYTSLGWGRDDARVEMRLRLVIVKKELR